MATGIPSVQLGYGVVNTARAEPHLALGKGGSYAGYDRDENELIKFLEGVRRTDFLQEMREEFYQMLVSVKTYGGFYIGRYETGNINSKIPVIKKGNIALGSETWYGMYKHCKNLKGSSEAVQTGMIWRTQWDETAKWLVDSGEKEYSSILKNNGNSWGNYNEVSFQYTNSNGVIQTKTAGYYGRQSALVPTGSTERHKANNIYDLAGNVSECTMGWVNEYNPNYGNSDRYAMGGSVSQYNYGRNVGYDYEIANPASPEKLKGTRSMLFINE